MNKMTQIFAALFLFFTAVQSTQSQNNQQELLEAVEEHNKIPRELAYLHLNKSLFLHGEQLGLTAYVVNKKSLRPSIPTSNLYVQIRNSNEEIVKEELLLVENGIATGVFDIDSEFVPGNYTITAFTNYMRNFDEQNFFTETIRILESNFDNQIEGAANASNLDVQFLPESGHLVSDMINHVGVVIKDRFGYGLPNAKVSIIDSRGREIVNLDLNQFGIGKFSFTPDINLNYTAVISHNDQNFPVDFNIPIEEEGITITAVKRHSKLRLAVNTNTESLIRLKSKPFVLLIQGRSSTQDHSVKFDREISVPLEFDLASLETGMNIITLFDEKNRPIAERLFFNYVGLPIEGIKKSEVINNNRDSLEVRFSFDGPKRRNLSVSILPENTISYNRNNSILSYNLLQPFVRGPIENGNWYFEEITDRKKYELDNLLITQGWSSYDWENIFTSKQELTHKFEENFEIRAAVDRNLFKRNDLQYMVHSTSKNHPQFVSINRENDSLYMKNFIPIDGERFIISRMKNNNTLVPAELQVEFFPNHIPDFRPNIAVIDQKPVTITTAVQLLTPAITDDFFQDAEDLGEVLIETKIDKEKERERRLGNRAWGKVSVVKDQEISLFGTLANYLRTKNLRVLEEGGQFVVTSAYTRTSNIFASDPIGSPSGMSIYLDGMIMQDASFFYQYPLSQVDYVEINKTGMGGGFLDSQGSIKIYSNFEPRNAAVLDRSSIQQVELPLTYSEKRKFYTPKYENTNDEFFQQFGVIDWQPNLRSRNGEDIVFQIKNPEVDYKMIIEGITEDGTLIYETATFSASQNEEVNR